MHRPYAFNTSKRNHSINHVYVSSTALKAFQIEENKVHSTLRTLPFNREINHKFKLFNHSKSCLTTGFIISFTFFFFSLLI